MLSHRREIHPDAPVTRRDRGIPVAKRVYSRARFAGKLGDRIGNGDRV